MNNKETQDHMLRIFIVGTTAVGKTKLSVQLAQKLKGKIISSDSKQLYKHVSIMTAKVTQQQAQGIPHFMVDCLDLHQNAYNRKKYFRQAFKALSTIEQAKKVPIIVGGTNYYTETLLYNLKNLTQNVSQRNSDSQGEQSEDQNKLTKERQLNQQQKKEIQKMKNLTVQQKYNLLMKHDKLIAIKTHRNDQKKITQFLQRILSDGKQISRNYEKFTSDLRTLHSLIFWVRNSDKDQLLGMVTKRIHKMLDKSGLTQIFAVYYYIQAHNKIKNIQTEIKEIEQYSGAASSIGIRQFKDVYLQVRDQIHQLFKEYQKEIYNHNQPNYQFIHERIFSRFETIKYSELILARCREQLILDTKHYCKRQITWIRNRFFVDHPQNRKHFFVLELSQNEKDQKMDVLQRFDKQVAKRAIEIVDKIQADGFGSILQDQKEFVNVAKTQPIDEWKKYYCEPCKIEINGTYDWNCHITSKRHQKQEKYFQKKQQRQKYIQQQKANSKGKRQQKQKLKNKKQQ